MEGEGRGLTWGLACDKESVCHHSNLPSLYFESVDTLLMMMIMMIDDSFPLLGVC